MRVNLNFRGGRGDGGLSVSGGDITGELMLFRDPVLPLEASTRQYVISNLANINASGFSNGTLSPARLPAFTGDLISMAGSGNFVLANSGVVAGTHAKVVVNAKGIVTASSGSILDSDIPTGVSWNRVTSGRPTTLSGYGITDAVPVTGGTMTGALTLSAAPVTANHSANRQYVDTLMSSVGTIAVGDIIRRPSETTPAGFLRCNGGIVSIAAFPALHAVIGQQFSGGNQTPGSGQPWRQQFFSNTSTMTDITNWRAEPALPVTTSHNTVFITRNRVFMIGGVASNAAQNTVLTAPINADGTLGTWVTSTPFPVALAAAYVIVTRNRVFLFGGWTPTVSLSTVYTAVINADGTLGAWTTAGSLPGTLSHYGVAITRNRVFLLGGLTSTTSATVTSVVYTALINADGTLGSWTTSTPLPVAGSHLSAVVTRNRLFVMSLWSGTVSLTSVFSAPINTDGTLGTWVTSTALPVGVHGSAVVATRNRVFVLNGATSAVTWDSFVISAPINADGTLGTWVYGTPTPTTGHMRGVVITSSRIYIITNWNGGLGNTEVISAPFTGGLNDYSPFYDGSMLPVDSATHFQLPNIDDTTYPGAFSYIKT